MTLARGDRVALLTSGGDAPGMNAALRGAARVGPELGLSVVGVEDGYVGLMEGRLVPLDLHALDDAARRGGTILGTARSKVFPTPEGRARACEVIARERLRALVVVGGNGSLAGARTLLDARTDAGGALAVAGLPASIDNDIAGTSMAIGVDTAMNTIVEACDRILDTASAHRRTFFVEVMGRDMGYLAMTAGIAAGADAVLVRETDEEEGALVDRVVRSMQRAYAGPSPRRHLLVLKAEGVKMDVARLKALVDARIASSLPDVDTRVTVLGHVVRGGTPTAFDRLLGARLANVAVRELARGRSGFMTGWVGPGVGGAAGEDDPYVVTAPIAEVLAETERMHRGESPLSAWRKRIYAEVETILDR